MPVGYHWGVAGVTPRSFKEAAMGRKRAIGSSQGERVLDAMSDGGWWDLEGLARAAGGTESGVSARVRDLRKGKWGGRLVERRKRDDGRYEYRLVPTGEC
jgi:hypothetical protein